MSNARVKVLREVSKGNPKTDNKWTLCLQWCLYVFDDGTSQNGYRFIWRRPESGHLQGARGQARIPSLKMAQKLIDQAIEEGWGDYMEFGDLEPNTWFMLINPTIAGLPVDKKYKKLSSSTPLAEGTGEILGEDRNVYIMSGNFAVKPVA